MNTNFKTQWLSTETWCYCIKQCVLASSDRTSEYVNQEHLLCQHTHHIFPPVPVQASLVFLPVLSISYAEPCTSNPIRWIAVRTAL